MDESEFTKIKKNAENGDANAQYEMGEIFFYGNIVKRSYENAKKWYELAAEQEHGEAQYSIGYLYHYGKGVEVSFTEAKKWYEMAIEKDSHGAYYHLGNLYLDGNGVEQSCEKANELFKKASELGSKWASYKLGISYFSGRGIEQSYSEAAKYFEKSIEYGNDDAKIMYSISKKRAHLREIYVIDTETTGINGYPSDLVLDVGITKVNLDDYTIENVYSSILGYDTSSWSDSLKNSWIFQNSDLKIEDIDKAPPADKVVRKVRKLLKGKTVTSFNVGFDFNKYLNNPPWSFDKLNITIATDIMMAADKIEEIPRTKYDHSSGWRAWPKLDASYDTLCPDDPANMNGNQDHRALSDAIMASHVMLRLTDLGKYNI